MGEISFIAVLKDQVKIVGCFLYIVEFDDIFVVAGFKDFNFVFQQLHEFPFDAFSFDGLDGDVHSVCFVVAFEDISILAGSDFPFVNVIINYFWHDFWLYFEL